MRLRVSCYDPFRKEIETWCKAGMPVREIANRLGPGYTMGGVYNYIHSRKLRTKTEVYDARNQCHECSYCHEYTNTNNSKGRICTKTWKTIQPMVKHCPVWCELEKAYEKM